MVVVNLHRPNLDALEMIEGIASRIKSGETVAVGAVEVMRDRGVATSYSNGSYHLLNSGAARLASRLASEA